MRTFVVSCLCILFFTDLSFPQQKLTYKNLERDLKYYYKISKEKNLTANDKLYILNRIYDKYKNSGLDLSKLKREIELVKESKNQISPQQQPQPQVNSVQLSSQSTSTQVVPKTSIDTDEEKYRISSGDILYIKISPAEELSKEVAVSPDGKIVLSLIGAVKAEGFTIGELRKNLEKLYSVYISNPKVSITIRYFSKKQLFIMGEVRNPGGYQYKEGIKLFELISLAGGFTPYAGLKNIKIYRGEKNNQQVIFVNLEEIISDISKDFPLQPGDIIEVPKQPRNVTVVGEVNAPGEYEWYEGMNIVKAISLAKGYTQFAKISNVRIHRVSKNNTKEIMVVNLGKILDGKAPNVALEPGDIVYIPKKPLVSSQWFVNTMLPWMTLLISVFILMTYISK